MKRGKYKKPEQTIHYRINHQIRASEVRLIGQDNKQIGVVDLQQALQQAGAAGLDLVEIAPKAQPPVAKIIDYKKFQYLESKKLSKQKKASLAGELKEVRFKPFMAEGDFQVKLTKVKKFLNKKHQVRLQIPFHGRQLAHKQFGFQMVDRIVKELGDKARLDQPAKFIGRKVIATISPGVTAKNKI